MKLASAGDVFFQVKSDLPFGATLAITFDLFLQITKIPDHGHGHVVSMPGGSTVLVPPVVPNQPADNIMQQMAQTRHELRQHPVNISPPPTPGNSALNSAFLRPWLDSVWSDWKDSP